MTLPSSISIQTTFKLYPSPSKFNIINLTPLVDEGITLTDVKGNFKITNPLGVTVYENTSTVSPDLYSFSVSSINRTLSTATVVTSAAHGLVTGDSVMIGGASQTDYNGLYTVTVVNTTTFTYTVNNSPVTPATGTISGLKMSLNTVTIPSPSGSTFPISGAYNIELTTIVAGAVQAGTYVKDFDYTYSYVRPTPNLTTSVDCFKAIYKNTDITTYAVNGIEPTKIFAHTIAYPAEANRSNEVYGTQVVELRYPKVYNGVYQNKIQTTLTYNFSDGLIVKDTVIGLDNFEVKCDVNLCQVTCALNDLNTEYTQATATDATLATQLYNKLNRALQLRDLYLQNQSCGNNTEASNILTEIYNVTGSNASCACGIGGQIIPYEGIVTGTIYMYDSETVFNQGIYMDYNNELYRVLETTLVGENPDSTPSKFANVSVNKTYVDNGLATKQDVFDDSNTATGSTSVTINTTSGLATFTSSIVSGLEYNTLTINNNLVTNDTKVAYGLFYIPNDTETCQISSYGCGVGTIVFYINNFSGVDAEQPKEIWFQILN